MEVLKSIFYLVSGGYSAGDAIDESTGTLHPVQMRLDNIPNGDVYEWVPRFVNFLNLIWKFFIKALRWLLLQ